MSYDKRMIYNKTLPLFDFGGGAAETYSFRLPPGYKGRLIGIGAAVTEIFATDTTVGSVAVGTAADADAYGLLEIPDTSADNDFIDTTDDTDAIISADVAAGQLVRVTLTNGTDASAVTGQAIPELTFEVWK